ATARAESDAELFGALALPGGARGLHPEMKEAVDRLLRAAAGAVTLREGYRSVAEQRIRWLEALEKYGDPEVADDWVARPGHSLHQSGLAVDLGGDVELAARLVGELGLPLWRPMSWEPWHFELVGSRG
ncbi:MAG: D-alanyl-D-alanine carboxypeptidase family protein, partial [Actinomycetota bacterium]